MKTAREITKRALELRFQHLLATDGDADAILAALAAEGYQIVPPGGIHGPTREAAARTTLAIKPKGGSRIVDTRRDHAHDIAAAIRSLEATHGE